MRVLGVQETKRLLRRLPYDYRFRSVTRPAGAEGAVAGLAVGNHRTRIHFGIALGHGHRGVPVPLAGTSESYGYPRGGFIFTDDLLIRGPDGKLEVNPAIRTATQLDEATRMAVRITDMLCRAATHEPCPI